MQADEFIKFVEVKGDPHRRTKLWNVREKAGKKTSLGYVMWWTAWRCYVLSPSFYAVFEQACLRQIASFVEQQTATHKAKKAKKT